MNILIDEMQLDELGNILNLVKRVFDEFEAPYYSRKGIENFYKFTNYDNLILNLDKNMKIFVAKDGNAIVGMIAIRDYSHISMLFVDKNYHRKGIASRLVDEAKYYCRKNSKINNITVNSSPYAVEFYHKKGFNNIAAEQIVDGITFIPMSLSIYNFEKYKDDYFKVLYEMKKDNFEWYVKKLYGWNEERQIEFHKDFIEKHRNDINVIKFKNKIIGIFTNYIDDNNESVISLFYIDKKYQRHGIGTEILREQLNTDMKNKRCTILQVFKENPARFLYQRVGFKIYEETDSHYKMRKIYKK